MNIKSIQSVTRLSVIFLLSAIATAQSGGPFVIKKSVIAGGGGRGSGGTFTLDGTSGESTAGTTSAGGGFILSGGFWGGGAAPATNSNITISGRIFASDGLTGLRNATVSITDPAGNVRTATTSSFGFYSFDNVATGSSYTIRIASRRFRFPSKVVVPTGDLANVDFIGLE